MPIALITGGSTGLGRELVTELSTMGWRVITDARHPQHLTGLGPNVTTIPGDVTDPAHRAELRAAVVGLGGLDLLVHNASTLGPTPLPALRQVNLDDLQHVWQTNIGAPVALTNELLPHLVASRGILVSISSDAAIEHYEGWGLYGASKAALDHLTLTYGTENGAITAYAVDPGDMQTAMHQAAFPGEDISDRPLPATVVPHLLALIETRPPGGRYRAAHIPDLEP